MSLVPAQFRLVAYVVAALAIAGAAYWTYDTIWDRGWAAHVVVAEKEKEAMRLANEQAIAAAEKGLREDVAALLQEKEKLVHDLTVLSQEAAQDPDAHTGGVKRNGVRRINAIR